MQKEKTKRLNESEKRRSGTTMIDEFESRRPEIMGQEGSKRKAGSVESVGSAYPHPKSGGYRTKLQLHHRPAAIMLRGFPMG